MLQREKEGDAERLKENKKAGIGLGARHALAGPLLGAGRARAAKRVVRRRPAAAGLAGRQLAVVGVGGGAARDAAPRKALVHRVRSRDDPVCKGLCRKAEPPGGLTFYGAKCSLHAPSEPLLRSRRDDAALWCAHSVGVKYNTTERHRALAGRRRFIEQIARQKHAARPSRIRKIKNARKRPLQALERTLDKGALVGRSAVLLRAQPAFGRQASDSRTFSGDVPTDVTSVPTPHSISNTVGCMEPLSRNDLESSSTPSS